MIDIHIILSYFGVTNLRKMFFTKIRLFCNALPLFLIFLISTHETFGQPDYGYLGEIVHVVNIGGDTLNDGQLLKEDILTDDQIEKFTYRYDSDTVITNRNGVEVDVFRLFDIYLPDDSLSFVQNGQEIEDLPVMVILHSGQGDKESAAENGLKWARRGYCAVVPSYRSDRLGKDYCFIYIKSLYLAAQDVSAVVRSLSYIYDDSKSPAPQLESNPFVNRPIDGTSIFLSGFSYGGTTALHLVTRMVQEQWEPFLGNDGGYVIDGVEGPLEIGDGGPLHSTGRPFIEGYEFPFDRIKGAMSRTAAMMDDDQLNLSLSPVKVPVQIVTGTCDLIIPYDQRTFYNDEGLCDARVEFPDGSADTSITFYGAQYISDKFDEADIYHEILTFCNGGHTSNPCVMDYINDAEIGFVTRILKEEFDHADIYEEVYRYSFENYSNQCCEIGDDYSYLEKCSCSDDNPYEVTDLEYIDMPACQFINECDLDSICDLLPLSSGVLDHPSITSNIVLTQFGGRPALKLFSVENKNLLFTYRTPDGKVYYEKPEMLIQGVNHVIIPESLPRKSIIILQIEGFQPTKFYLSSQ